jgi:hypothetical protein
MIVSHVKEQIKQQMCHLSDANMLMFEKAIRGYTNRLRSVLIKPCAPSLHLNIHACLQ